MAAKVPQLIKKLDNLKAIEPAFGQNERFIWFSQRKGAWNYNAQMPQYQIATYDRKNGRDRGPHQPLRLCLHPYPVARWHLACLWYPPTMPKPV